MVELTDKLPLKRAREPFRGQDYAPTPRALTRASTT